MKRPGETLVSLIIVLLIMIGIAAATLPSNDPLPNPSDQILIDQLNILDRSLATWAKHHSGQYPDQLDHLIEVEILSNTMSLANFTYVKTAPKYSLTATLSNGTVYKSPESNP